MRIYDISPLVSPRSAVFPGDRPFSRHESLNFEKGDHLELSHIETTVHVGAHADAPSHYDARGQDIASRPLDFYMGLCQLIEVHAAPGARLATADLKVKIDAPRVLFRTNSWPDPDKWTDSFNSLSPELVIHLSNQGVVLVGIDTPSMDPHDSKKLESHQAIYARDMAVLEGLRLNGVPEGHYELIALPLKLAGADASPVRAVLRTP